VGSSKGEERMNQDRRAVHTDGAPAALGPYSQGIVLPHLGLVFSSGQIGLDPRSGQIVAGGIEPEMTRVLENLDAVLRAAGSGLDQVVRTTLYLIDLGEFDAANRIYGEVVGAPLPARSTVEVSRLPKGARVEMDVIATVRSTT
jgi:2-iminobutanoate/2-iminopropanoate deaminase